MTEGQPVIDGPVARELLDAIVSFLPTFECPGCSFGVWDADGYDKLSAEAEAFTATVWELYVHLRRSLPQGADSPQWQTACRIMHQDSELLATTDLTVLCVALCRLFKYSDAARGGPGVLWCFQWEGFLPLLRHIKELCTRPAEK